MDDAGIPYTERTDLGGAFDIDREDADRHTYQLEPGQLTIYVFQTIERRVEVQLNPFPNASVKPPNGSYGLEKMLIFYHGGDEPTARALEKALEPLGVFVNWPQRAEKK